MAEKMKKYSIIFLLLMFNLAYANVFDKPSDLKTISSELPKIGSIKCKFKQQKLMQNVSKPVISYGDFEYIENEGVYFHTTFPIKSEVNYTNKNYKQINDVINAISSKNYKRIEKEFSFYFENNKKNWVLGLKPKKNTKTGEVISNLTVYGNSSIDKIEVEMLNGTKTILWFQK